MRRLSLVSTVVNLVRGHDVLDKVFLEYIYGKNLLLYGQTRMATWFLMAQRLLEQKANLDLELWDVGFESLDSVRETAKAMAKQTGDKKSNITASSFFRYFGVKAPDL